MRTENEMFHTIINAAKSDDRVLAALLASGDFHHSESD